MKGGMISGNSVAGVRVEEHEHAPERADNDCRVRVLQERLEAVDQKRGVFLALGAVAREGIEEDDLAPLAAAVDRAENRAHCARVEPEDRGRPALVDLEDRRRRVRHGHRILAAQEREQVRKERRVLNRLRDDVVELDHPENRGFGHVRVRVAERPLERDDHVLRNALELDPAHRTHGERPDERVCVAVILGERVHGHYRLLGLLDGVADQVQVCQLLSYMSVVQTHRSIDANSV